MSPREKVLRPLLENLRTGVRIGLFRPFMPGSLRVDLPQVVLLFLLSLALGMLSDYIHVRPARVYDGWGVVSTLAGYTVFLFALYLVAQIQGRLERFGRFVVAMLAVLPVEYLLRGIYRVLVHIDAVHRRHWLVWTLYILVTLWLLAIAYWAQRGVFSRGRWRTLIASVVYFAVMALQFIALPHTRVWYTNYADANASRPRLDVEHTYYAQPALLDAELSRLKPQRPGIHDIYFVGVAGYANQNVFLREARSVRKLFDTRYGTAGRSILLVNNPATVHDLPLADASNLKSVLDRIGKLMNPREDMLFLTSPPTAPRTRPSPSIIGRCRWMTSARSACTTSSPIPASAGARWCSPPAFPAASSIRSRIPAP